MTSKLLNFIRKNEFRLLRGARKGSLLLLGGLIFLTLAGTLVIPRLNTHYSMKQFLPQGHPLVMADDKAKARFQLSELEPVLVVLEHPHTWLDEDRIHKLRSATERVAQLDPAVEKAISLATVEGASPGRGGITVGRLLELTPPENWSQRVLGDPILTPQILSQDERTTVVVATLSDVPMAKMTEIQEKMRALLQETFPETKVSLGGVPAVQAEMSRVLGLELRNFLGLSLAASIGMLLLFFRTVTSVLVPLVLVVMANVLSLAWMAATGVPFTVLTTTLPVLVAITVVSMSTHTMLRYASDWDLALRTRTNPNPLRILFRSYRGLLLPNTLTAITTAVGFLAVSITEVPLIRQYGWTVGVSIFVCWFVVIVALPPLLVLAPVPRARSFTEAKSRWALLPVAFKKQTVVAITLLCALLAWIGKDLNWSPHLFDDLPRDQEARRTTEQIDAHLGGMIPLGLTVEFPEENAWNDPNRLERLERLAARWRTDERVGSAVSLAEFLRAAGQVQGRGMPSSRQQAAEDVFLYTFADSNPLRHFLTADGRAARLQLRTHDVPATSLQRLVREAEASARDAFPGAQVTTSGMATTVHELHNELSRELIYGFWQALALISVVLLFTFRSLRWTIAAVVPNLVPPVTLLGALALFDTPIKPGIAVIFSIALGISFDNTIYLLGRLRLIQKTKRGLPVAKAWYQEA
ncbi:MAG: MMPL family transporter, partial [Bdellovibrionales bacterium]|nr:MMPL family transporter [Bdellovibrionales bacterium]